MSNGSRKFWTTERYNQLCNLAATGMVASEIGAILGTSKHSVISMCGQRGIAVVMHTEAEIATIRANARAREKRKQAKLRARRREQSVVISVAAGTSKTAPIYRNQLPRLPEMTKNELRAMLAQAVRNTAEMTA